MAAQTNELRLILGDQLNRNHSWFEPVNDGVLYVMMEIKDESEYVTHHIQKIAGIFAAMREFASFLKKEGHHLVYYKICDKTNKQSFEANIKDLLAYYPIERIRIQEPDEYRLDALFRHLSQRTDLPKIEFCSSEHFLTKRMDVADFFKNKKSYLMESFYREMRKKHSVLLTENNEPEGGKWNYDKSNRYKLPKNHRPKEAFLFEHDLSDIVDEIRQANLNYIGEIDAKHFIWPLNPDEANTLFDYFLNELFEHFGTYQDAMSHSYWSIYHSRISFALNLKMLSPLTIILKAEAFWRAHPEIIDLAQCEGFIRQILGWREYVRGLYWAKMPDYKKFNFFNFENELPSFYWDAKTKMNCLQKSIQQSLQFSYAHHIQRLMVTGNFALLAGIDPDAVDRWYLGIYIDAFEWVELPNTRGMSQFADGGLLGTKPYISSATYIQKMSDYCNSCYYDYKKKTGEKACPFNSLYWNFLAKNENELRSNHRMRMMYAVWDKMDKYSQKEIIQQAEYYLAKINQL